ncbi:NADH-ubiquinone oxidoreductase chain 6 (mitochondrion) [Picochlorum sp. SENEW3]|jgi:NADH-ubiquinone oxidoreductase chain 6|nr:NADH-ubiquinone oxidoreductase chain 6 [Picochlorum sp. SENEW3]
MNTLFYVFASLMLASGVMVIQSRNPVYSVLFLILVFFHGAALLLLLGLDFFAMTFLVVYVGAIAVLFLFVVMMLDINMAELQERRLRYLPVGGVLGLLFILEGLVIVDVDLVPLLYTQSMDTSVYWTNWTYTLAQVSNMHTMGRLLYTYYGVYFLVASLILLVAMVGAIVLTQQRRRGARRQHVYIQNTRDFARTIRKVS